ncbi:MAG: hypothetical protein IKI04_02465 [Bacilli bacterium]|nr:hypothetical protein [Bacilli bacterium]
MSGATNCGPSGTPGVGGGPSCLPGIHKYCNIKVDSATESATLNEDVYDSQGNYIGSGVMLQDKIILTSGRFVGIDAYEIYQKTFYVSMKPECVEGTFVTRKFQEPERCCTNKTQWVCYSTGTFYSGSMLCVDCCTSGGWETWEDCVDCTKTVERTVLECNPCSISPADCRGEAEAELQKQVNNVKWQPAYMGYRQDVNDIREGVDNKGNPTIEVPSSHKIEDLGVAEPADRNSTRLWRTYTAKYRYNLPSAWIEPSTGRVKYANEIKDSEKSTYYETEPMYIEDNGYKIQIGKYYIPLNATNDDLIKYNLLPNPSNNRSYSKELCSAVIDKYSTRSETKPFWGDFLMYKNAGSKRMIYEDAKTATAAKNIVSRDNGCRMGLRIAFKIAEDYYKSEGGYNYYYRQIDYSQPFPNGMASNGFWYGRYDAKSNSTVVTNADGKKDTYNSQDLDNSFSKVTYRTNQDYTANTIREYNKASNNPKDNRVYSSWLEMNNSGTSSFINSAANGISRNGCQKFYSLGCGPANSNWAQCKVTEVCH